MSLPLGKKVGRRPSSEYVNPDEPKSTLRPWKEVAEMYTQITGEPMTDVRAKDFAIRALEKLNRELMKRKNGSLLTMLRSQLS